MASVHGNVYLPLEKLIQKLRDAELRLGGK